MAKSRQSINQLKNKPLPEYSELISTMQAETASILTDYIRQWIGTIGQGIYLNKDRVGSTQVYQELAWYDLYAEVERDPHVGAVLMSAKLNVAGIPWDVSAHVGPGEKKPSARNLAVAQWVKEMLGGVGFLPQHLYNLMDCVGKGFSVSEIIWEVNDNGIGVKEILNRPQRRFQFDAEDRTLRLRSILAPYFGEPLPDKKFIVHRVSSTWENPFGDPLDQNIYWIWLFKRTVLKFWMQHLEVGAASVPIVKHPASANAEMKSEALAIAKQIRSGAYGRIPENFEILWAEAKNAITNAQTYEMFVKMCDEQVSKAIQGQTLTTDTGKSGTRAQGQVHQVTQDARDLFRAHGLESTLNTTLVKWAVDFNFANVDGYPRFRFDLEESEDLVNEAGIVKTISDAGYNFDEEELSEKFNYSLTKKEPLMSILPSGSGSQSPTAEFSQNKLLDAVIAVAVGGEKGKKEFVGLIEQKEDSFFEKFSGVFSKAIESLKPPIVNVEAPVVNVQSPAINVAPPIVHVPAPVVNVQPASVNVIMPEPKQKKMKIVAPDGKVYSIESNG